MARLHLVVGPVGSGKSTFARSLAAEHRAVRLTLDEWMATLFRPDRPQTDVLPWYNERVERCVEQIWQVARDIVAVDIDVVLEIGLIRREQRERFYSRIDAEALELNIVVVDADREVRRARVERRNREQGETYSMFVPPEIFELASDLWEPLTEAETTGRMVLFVSTDQGAC